MTLSDFLAIPGAVEHDGGPCPVQDWTVIRPFFRGPEDTTKGVRITLAPAWRLDWSHDGADDDIIAYIPENTNG